MSATATESKPAVADHRLGFQSLAREHSLERLDVRGEMPAWLTGSLVRTGPARFEVGLRSVRHWFDGLAMLHRFAFADGHVSYANRFLRSGAFKGAEESGDLAMSEFGTDPCRSLFQRVTSSFSPALTDNGSVNVSRAGDDYIAMTETPLPVVFDPRTLATAGVADWAKAIPGQISTAHPHQDPVTGDLVNYAAHLGARSSYRLYRFSDGAPREFARIPVTKPSYMHSFAITERHVVLAEFPLVVEPLRLALSGRPFIENYRWSPERGTRFLVIDRETGKLRARAEGPALFAFHHVNARDDGDDVVLDMCAYEDPSIIDALYLDRLREADPVTPVSRLTRCRVPLDSGEVSVSTLADEGIELPRINYRRCNGRDYRYVYGTGGGGCNFLDRIVRIDVESGSSSGWSEPGCYPGEPVFVPAPKAADEGQGVLLSVVLDARRGASCLLVLDAETLTELARAEVPHAIPFGFHGNHFPGLTGGGSLGRHRVGGKLF